MTGAEVDISELDRLTDRMAEYGTGAGKIVQQYLQDDGLKHIAPHIQGLINPSGRTWKGKAKAAESASYTSVFKSSVSSMTLTVETAKKYNYLYFPDDGGNSRRHAGNQQFMKRGADEATDEIVDEIVERLVKDFEEG